MTQSKCRTRSAFTSTTAEGTNSHSVAIFVHYTVLGVSELNLERWRIE